MNNNTFKNTFDTNFGANFNIETTNNVGKIINTHYNIHGKIYPKNLDFTRNKFKKNNEKRQIILKNSSCVNVLLTFFHYNNTNNSWNNSWFYGENMFNFTHIKQGFWEIFRKIFEEIKENSETILKNNSAVNVLLTFFPYNNTNNSGNNNWFYGGNMLSFCYIKQGFWEIFKGIKENSETILKNNSAINVLLTFFHYNNTNNSWFYGGNMFSFCYIKQGFWEIFRKIFEKINLDSETILENNSYVNVLLTFFPYNNTNNTWFYEKNMFSFCYIKEKFLEIFRKIFEGINLFNSSNKKNLRIFKRKPDSINKTINKKIHFFTKKIFLLTKNIPFLINRLIFC